MRWDIICIIFDNQLKLRLKHPIRTGRQELHCSKYLRIRRNRRLQPSNLPHQLKRYMTRTRITMQKFKKLASNSALNPTNISAIKSLKY